MALYKEASRILKLVCEQRGSIKNLTFSSSYRNKRQLYALVIETLKHNKALQEILHATKIHRKEQKIKDIYLAKTLLYDFLFGKGLSGTGTIEKAVMSHAYELRSAMKKLKTKAKIAKKEDLCKVSVALPRYVRVNTLKTTVEAVIDSFVRDGFQLKVLNGLDYNSYLNALRDLQENEFTIDIHIPQLLVFSSGKDFHEHTLYKSGLIILQDKASCFPAIVLNPREGSHVIDCCAAPGNKTTFMAALMNNNGMIFAFDLDSKRVTTMKVLCQKAGTSCLSICKKDFLHVNPQDSCYRNVEYILVDPSCSGSGIAERTLAFASEPGPSVSRLKALASFQAMILNHALSFPKVKRVVYSTCSIHKEENEKVVFEILKKYEGIYHLKHILPQLSCRGDRKVFSDAVKCVRMNPYKSLTNGFFISCFERNVSKAS